MVGQRRRRSNRDRRVPADNDSDADYLRVYEVSQLVGLLTGLALCIGGAVFVVLGFSGSIEVVFEAKDFVSRVKNASPGVFFALIGAILLWRYKPSIEVTETRASERVPSEPPASEQATITSDIGDPDIGNRDHLTITKSISLQHKNPKAKTGSSLGALPSAARAHGQGAYQAKSGSSLAALPSAAHAHGQGAHQARSGSSLGALPFAARAHGQGAYQAKSDSRVGALPSAARAHGQGAYQARSGGRLSAILGGPSKLLHIRRWRIRLKTKDG